MKKFLSINPIIFILLAFALLVLADLRSFGSSGEMMGQGLVGGLDQTNVLLGGILFVLLALYFKKDAEL